MNKILFILFWALLVLTALSKDILVVNLSELNSAILNAEPNDVIIMEDGIWTDAIINFNSKAIPGGPIILKAKTQGKVILNGGSKLIFSNPYLMAEGLYFREGSLSGSNSENADKVILFDSDRCRLKNTVIENYNPKKFSTYYYWVFFSGNNNRLDNCTFIGKNHLGPVIGNDYSGIPKGKDSKHNKVEYCYFKDIPYNPANDREILRIWGYGRSEEKGFDGAFFIIENNLFENADGEGSEIISLKSNYNTIRYNTIIESRGSIVGRSGNFNTILGNFIIGNNKKGTGGIRVAGQAHTVMNNYISEVAGDGLVLMAGELIDSSLTLNYIPVLRESTPFGRVPRYGWVKNGMFANNTFVNNSGADIILGFGYKNDWPKSQQVLLPEENTFMNNIIQKSNNGKAISIPEQDKEYPLDKFNFKPQIFYTNIFYGGTVEINPLPNGIKIIDPILQLAEDGLYRPLENSPVRGAGVEPLVDEDIDGQRRKYKCDIGADEISSLPILIKPHTSKSVGAEWMRDSFQVNTITNKNDK